MHVFPMDVHLQLSAHSYNILPAKLEGNLHMGGSLNLEIKYTIEILHNNTMDTN